MKKHEKQYSFNLIFMYFLPAFQNKRIGGMI